MQSPNLREIASQFDPVYRARADVVELNMDFKLSDHLTLTSQSAYNQDQYFSQEDYNRFNTVPGVFNDSEGLKSYPIVSERRQTYAGWRLLRSSTRLLQLHCRTGSVQCPQPAMVAGIRLSSSFEGPINFSVGANYLHYKTIENYYVFFNILSALSQAGGSA